MPRTPARAYGLQRKCACGQHTIAGGECDACQEQHEEMLQRSAITHEEAGSVPSIVHETLRAPGQPLDGETRALMERRLGHDFSRVTAHPVETMQRSAASNLSVGPAGDEFEREAETVAARALRDDAAASVGGPAGGYDLSRVRVHTDERAAASAQALGAAAYTVGHDVVFGAGQYAPRSPRGRALLAHELTHVVQQGGGGALQPQVLRRSETVYGFFSNMFQAIFSMGFSDETLQAYMDEIAKGAPEGDFDSDNKAVEVVKKWKAGEDKRQVVIGERSFPMTSGIKVSLAQEVMMGDVSGDDAQSMLDLLSLSSDSETAALINAVGEEKLKKEKPLAEFLKGWHKRGGEQIAALKPEDQLKKDKLVEFHQKQQRHVASLIAEGLKLQPDASKGVFDPDNLFHNSCEFVDKGEVLMVVLTPTHDSKEREGGPAYFDQTVKHPDVGGNYPADSKVKDDERLFFARGYGDDSAAEEIGRKAYSKVFKKETVFLRTPGDDLIDTRSFRNVLVHEVQHEADKHEVGGSFSTIVSSFPEDTLLGTVWARYQSEFRAYWIQPPSKEKPIGFRYGIDPDFMGQANQPAENKYPVSAKGPKLPGCKSDSAPTDFKNKRQEDIFWYLSQIGAGFDVPYVCTPKFKKLVDDFTLPASGNLVNSVRVQALAEALKKCDKKMDAKAPELEAVRVRARGLDALDRAFLKDENLSAPLWRLLRGHIPDGSLDEITKLIKP